MAVKKHSSLDKVLGRLDQLDEANLHNLVQRLVRERTMLEAVFNTLQEGVLVIDAAGVIEYANESAARLIGLNYLIKGDDLRFMVDYIHGVVPGSTTDGGRVLTRMQLIF